MQQQQQQQQQQPQYLLIFIDGVVDQKYALVSQKGLITQRSINSFDFRKFNFQSVLEYFKFQKWLHLLTFPNTYYMKMVYRFFANLRKGRSRTKIVSRMNGVDIRFDPNIVNLILNTKVE